MHEEVSGVGMSDGKMKGVAKFVSGNSNVLCEIGARNEVVDLNSLWIEKIINMYADFPGDEEFMCVSGAALERKEENWFKKVEKGWG